MSLNLFYTMVQKSQKWPKTQIKGGSCLKPQVDIQWILSVIIVWVRNGASKSVVMGNSHCLRFMLRWLGTVLGRTKCANFLVKTYCLWHKHLENEIILGGHRAPFFRKWVRTLPFSTFLRQDPLEAILAIFGQTQTQTQTHLFKQDYRKSITTYLSCAPVRRE